MKCNFLEKVESGLENRKKENCFKSLSRAILFVRMSLKHSQVKLKRLKCCTLLMQISNWSKIPKPKELKQSKKLPRKTINRV